jgi:hypothetical protein
MREKNDNAAGDRRRRLFPVVGVAALLAGCGGGTGPGIGCVVVSVSLSPEGALTLEVGEVREVTATVQDNGGCNPKPEPVWQFGDAEAATLSATRGATITVTGAIAGREAGLTAAAGGKSSAPLAVRVVTPRPTSLDLVEGDLQTAVVGTPVPISPAVRVLDARGNPIAGVPVGFKVPAGIGSVRASGAAAASDSITVATNASGVAAAAVWTLGERAGKQRLNISIATGGVQGNPTFVSATATAGPPAEVAVESGSDQRHYAGVPVPVSPAVVIRDRFGNFVSGVGVTFAATMGGGSVTDGSPTTGVDGIARVGSWTLGAAGLNRLSVDVPGAGLGTLFIYAEAITIITLGAGASHSCVSVNPVGVYCWGANGHGQLGDGSTTDRSRPVVVLGTSTRAWSTIDGGDEHTCALDPQNLASWCWGGNAEGQLGTGDVLDRVTLGSSLGASPTQLFAAGGAHTCRHQNAARLFSCRF